MRAALATLLLVGCAGELVERPPPPPADWKSLAEKGPSPDAGRATATEKERAASAAYVRALASPDFSALKPMLDDEVHFSFVGTDDARGAADIVRRHQLLFAGLNNRAFALSRVLITDNSQVLEWVLTANHDASKRPVTLRGLTALWTRDDGSITDIHLYFDRALLQAQTGDGPKGISAPTVTAPAGPPQTFEQVRSEGEAAGVAVVRASLDALENNDETAYVNGMTDDVEVIGLESSWQGQAGARTYFRTMRKAIGNLDTTIDAAWGVGSFVVCEYHIVGEQRGSIAWVPAQKDNFLKIYLVDVVELRGGKIARVWRYDDPSQVLATTKVARP